MNLSFLKVDGDTISIDVLPDTDLHRVMALLEEESGIPAADQVISFEGRKLEDPYARVSSLGVTENSILSLNRRSQKLSVATQSNPTYIHRLGTPITEQVLKSPVASPLSPACHKCGEQQAVEHIPETLEEVEMLYVPVEVNGHVVNLMVGCSLPYSSISPDRAEAYGLMEYLDKRFAGTKLGIGAARIFGKIDVQVRVGDVDLPCSFVVVEGHDFLLGLDMLRTHRACIDLEKEVLRIKGCEVPFASRRSDKE